MYALLGKEKQWYAVRTRYKCEKLVARDLASAGVETYVPLIRKTRRYARKIKEYRVPLIHNYAFVLVDKSQYVTVLRHPHVIDYVRTGKLLSPIPADEIDILRRVCGEHDLQVSAEQAEFRDGQTVELIYGHLSGIRGRLIETRGKREFVVLLRYIGYQLRVLVDKSMLRSVAGSV